METRAIDRTRRLGSRAARGFSLIELMVTVGIVAILTTIAYPNYQNYVIRGQLTQGTDALSALRANMERYFQDNRTYAATGVFVPPCGPPAYTVGNFTLQCTAAPTNTGFTIQAQGTGGVVTGFTFFVDQNDNQSTTVGPPAPSSWTSCPATWVSKAGAC